MTFLRGGHLEGTTAESTALRRSSRAWTSATWRWGLRGSWGAELAHLHTLVEGVEQGHVVLVELKVEDLGVAANSVGGQGLWQDDVANLETPSEQNLSGSLAVLCSNRLDLVSLQSGTLSHRGVSLDVDTTGDGSLTELLVLEEGVGLDLVDNRADSCALQQVVELLDVEVGDTDGQDLACVDGGLEVLPGLDTSLWAHVSWAVEQVHVNVVDLELLERVLEGLGSSLVVSIPKLGGDEDVLSGDTRLLGPCLDGTSDGLLVGVAGSSINVAVSGLEGCDDSVLGGAVVWCLVNTESDL